MAASILIIADFIGRLHPLLVHLPIGILLLAVCFWLMTLQQKFNMLRPAVTYALLFGAAAAAVSCVSGFLLSKSGDYDGVLVSRHQWLGIALTATAVFAYRISVIRARHLKWLLPLMTLLLFITGHLGGSLTHGEGYLTKSSSAQAGDNVISKPIADVQQAVVYADIIRPILEARCYNCHGAGKQKGELRLDAPAFILEGGETGKAVVPGSAGESELIKRIILAADHKDHMPPRQKPQLTQEQIELLTWWVNTGAGFDKKASELEQSKKIKACLGALQSGATSVKADEATIPTAEVEKAPDSVIQKLQALDVTVNAVAKNSHYLAVNFVAVNTVTPEHLRLIKKLQRQIVWLKLDQRNITDTVMKTVGALTALTKLWLGNSGITNNGLTGLKNLAQLQYLNLSGTAITAEGLSGLNGLKNLRWLYLYKTGVSGNGYRQLQQLFPKAQIDTGGYTLQRLASDTMRVKPPLMKN